MKLRLSSCALTLMLLGLAGPSRAQSILDGGFEDPSTTSGGYTQFTGTHPLGAWTVVGYDVLLINTGYTEPKSGGGTLHFNAREGSNAVDLTGAGNTGPTDGVEQTVTTTVGQLYSLSFYVGTLLGSPDARYNAPNNSSTGPATVVLQINGSAGTSFTNTDTSGLLGYVDYKQFTTTFTATGTSTTIAFLNGNVGDASVNNYAGLDNVTLTAVPEPASLISSGIALVIGMTWTRRRRTKFAA